MESGLLAVLVLGGVVVEAVVVFLVAPIADGDGLVVAVFDGDEAKPLGTVEVRRAAEARVDFFLSSSEIDG